MTHFLCGLSKNNQMSIFMKIRRVEAEWFHAVGYINGQKDTTKLKKTLAYNKQINIVRIIV